MLQEINVKDIALIKKANVECGSGLNIMTGETGAGKSIIIGSAMLALGGKAPKDMIRKGAEYAYVELIFSVEDEERTGRLKELGFAPDENGLIVVSRKIMPTRSIIKINDETVTVSKLREVTDILIDIYGQHEQQSLQDSRKHLGILDEYLGEREAQLRAEVKNCYKRFKETEKALSGFDLDEKERLREIDLAAYEIDEIDRAAVRDGEEEELSLRFKKLNNVRNITVYLDEAYEILDGMRLTDAVGNIEHALRYDEELKSIYDQMIDLQSIADDVIRDIHGYVDELETDEQAFAETEQRLDLVRGILSKYGPGFEDMTGYRDDKARRLEELNSYEENKLRAEKNCDKAKAELVKACSSLSELRKSAAKELCAALLDELKELGFEHIDIALHFEEKAPAEDGCDSVRFMTALNPGEPLMPLDQVASGGELSRIMLAVKTILAETDRTPTLIFDEIDTGISGRTAQKVAEKLHRIAGRHQVICITHLPQIAAMADTHFVISKRETDGRNVTSIERLSEEESLNELARLLGGAEITETVYQNAVEMKKLAKRS